MTTAIVVCGGGSRGAIQVGMPQELLDSGLTADLIVGVWARALNGAFLAAGANAATAQPMADLWSRVRTRQILGPPWRELLGLARLRPYRRFRRVARAAGARFPACSPR